MADRPDLTKADLTERQYDGAWFTRSTHLTGALLTLGEIACDTGQYETAWVHYREALAVAWEKRSEPLTRMVLAHIAVLLAREGRIEAAAGCALLVRNHPRAYAMDKTRAGRVLDTAGAPGVVPDLDILVQEHLSAKA